MKTISNILFSISTRFLVIASALLFLCMTGMHFTSSRFQKEAPETSTHKGAGVLPYCIINNETYFLLSKEGYGRAKNTWCDFGGSKDKGETPLQTAAREGWEESRDLLGNRKKLEKRLATASSIHFQSYQLYFLKIENPQKITNEKFRKKKYRQFCRIEKTQIAWVRADEVFQAAYNENRFSKGDLREFFARIIRNTLNDPQGQKVLQDVSSLKALPFQKAS